MPSIGKIEAEIEMLPDQTTEVAISPVAASQLVSRVLQAITPLRKLVTIWLRKTTTQVRVLVVLIANKTGRIYSSRYFMSSAKFLTYGGILLCLLLALRCALY